MKKSRTSNKYMKNLGRLLDDASYLVSGVDEIGQTDEFRRAFLDSIKLVKLEEAKVRSTEGMKDLVSLIYYESIKPTKDRLSSVNFVDQLLVHNLKTYEKLNELLEK